MFENYLVAFELTEEERFHELDWLGSPIFTKQSVKRSYQHFKLKELNKICKTYKS